MTLPNFLIIGAMKSGTTSLWRYLRSHPEVFMPTVKEPHFFSGEKGEMDLPRYLSKFQDARGERAIGEASTSYTKFPEFQGVPAKIKTLIPDARFIYMVRDPVERMRSQYQHAVINAVEKRPLKEALLKGKAGHFNTNYAAFSSYATQLEQYLEHFERDRLLVITLDDLSRRTDETLTEVGRFLDIAAFPPETDVRELHLRTADRKALRPTAAFLRRSQAFRRVRRKLRVKPPERLIRKNLERVEIDDETRVRLRESLVAEMDRFMAITGRRFPEWGFE